MESKLGRFRVILPVYHYTTVEAIYPSPSMHSAALLDDDDLARIAGAAIAGTYGRAYLLSNHTNHVLTAWTLRPEGVHQAEAVWAIKHRGVGLVDTTIEAANLGGNCPECRTVLDSLPEAPDPRTATWPDSPGMAELGLRRE